MTSAAMLLRLRPICEARVGLRTCPKLAVSIERDTDRSRSPRCPDHTAADARRFCSACRRPNDSHDPWLCISCRDREAGSQWR